jgi:LmbE family N-acetylglucosaminyl deacetylase
MQRHLSSSFWLALFLVCATAIALSLAPSPTLSARGAALQAAQAGQIPKAPASPGPDDRYKADILVIVAHPDDETMVTAYLAKAIFDEHKRVAVIYGTRGDGGGDVTGYEQAAALGAKREIEARRALDFFGVMNAWFLDGPDTPGQDVLRSLETWNHGAALGKAVRLVRLTRPEVILTWLPDYVAGENHDDHQAAGVIATEAFDLAGDPTSFPEQVSAPRNRHSISSLTEGLRLWQPKKIYYFSDASHTEFLEGRGPKFDTTKTSPSRHEPYYKLSAEQMSYHLTQDDSGQMAKQALATGKFDYFKQPVRLVFGKSLVGGSTTGEPLEGVATGPVPFAPVRGYQTQARSGLAVELGGPWAFYREFWKAHNLEHLASLLPNPEVSVQARETMHIPLVIRNDTDSPAEVTLTVSLPQGWRELSGVARYPVAAHDIYPAQTFVEAPAKVVQTPQEVTWKAETNGQTIATIKIKIYMVSGGLPQ